MSYARDAARSAKSVWLVGLLVVGVLSACSPNDDTYLPALLADPMASYEAEGVELIDRATQSYGRDPIFGKYQSAEVTLVYRILDQSDSQAVLEAAVEYAEDHGWLMMQTANVDSAFAGEKEFAAGEALLVVRLDGPGTGETGPIQLRIKVFF